MVEFTFEKHAVGTPHSHPHEQVGYIKQGRFDAVIAGSTATLEEGDSYYVPPSAEHGVVALEPDGVIIDVFTPMREDFLE